MRTTDQSLAPYVLHRAPSVAAAPPELPEWKDSGPIGDLLGILKRRWKTIAITLAVAVTLTGAYCALVEPRYRARAILLIEPRGREVLPAAGIAGAEDAFGSTKYDYYLTQYRLLKSPTIARRVIDELKLATDLRFVDGVEEHAGGAAAPATEAAEAAIVGRYLQSLDILPERMTRLVSIAFESKDPHLAAEVANAHARAFVSHDLEREYAGMRQIRTFLDGKLQELYQEMQRAEQALMNYQSAHHLLPVDLHKDVAGARLMDLSRKLTEAEAERIALEAEYRLVQSGDATNLPSVFGNPTVQRLREDYNRLELEHALLAAKWRPTYPALRQLRSQLDRAKSLLDAEIRKAVDAVGAKYRSAEATVEQIRGELERQRKLLVERKDEEGKLLTLAREAETTRTLYDNLLEQVKKIDIVRGANISHISIAEPAMAPRHPSSPRTVFNLLLSTVTGLLVGVGLAFLRESLDRTIRDSRSLERATGIGTLAVVPDLRAPRTAKLGARRFGATNLPVVNGPGGAFASGDAAADATLGLGTEIWSSVEAYRTLRTSLLLKQAPNTPRTIVFTSAVGTEGKTTTAVNTAVALASCGTSVLLIDSDLRLPRCHEALGLPRRPGLGEYLAGQLRSQPIQTTDLPNLSFVGAGRAPLNPTELLTSWRMWQLVRGARERFDYVIIDSPPVLAVSDALLLANIADGVVLVVQSRRSREDQAHAAIMRLHRIGAVILGTVLNRGEVDHEYYHYAYARPASEAATEGANTVVVSQDTSGQTPSGEG
jgi:capsular exopolysaccharide synthesis family protein